jgi:hypothetical protein
MAKAKKTRPREHLIRWRVSLITATPVKFIDFTRAPDAETAEEQLAEAHDINVCVLGDCRPFPPDRKHRDGEQYA